MIPKQHVPDLIGDGNRFPAFAKPASAGEGRSEKIVLNERGPRIIATDRQAPRIYSRMIPLCSRFDSVLFTPKTSAIASYGNYSRSPCDARPSGDAFCTCRGPGSAVVDAGGFALLQGQPEHRLYHSRPPTDGVPVHPKHADPAPSL